MPIDNEIASKTPGQALMDVPVPKLIELTGKAIANAQLELDAAAVRAATLMGETRVEFRGADGKVVPRSLLELGFAPSFYHFDETDMEFKVTVTVSVDFSTTFHVNVPVMSVATIGLDVHHKYGFDMTAASTIRTHMVAIPPPQTFLKAIQDHAAAGGTIAVADAPASVPSQPPPATTDVTPAPGPVPALPTP